MVTTYLAAKEAALTNCIDRLRTSIKALEQEHQGFASFLSDQVGVLEKHQRLFKMAVQIDQEQSALRALWDFEKLRLNLETVWIPALEYEGPQHRLTSVLLKRMAKESGVDYIQDAACLIGHSWAVWPLPQYPLFYIPMYQDRTLFEYALVYHEFGHTFTRRHQIINAIHAAVTGHFAALLQQGVKGLPDQIAARQQEIIQCAGYWSEERIDEIFCDLFATYVSGPAFLCSWLDFTARFERKPYRIATNGVHPPDGFRSDACLRLMGNQWKEHALMQWARAFWTKRRGPGGGAPNDPLPYHVVCSDQVMDTIISATVQELERLKVPRFQGYIPSKEEARVFDDCSSLVTLVNAAVTNHLFDPLRYADWEAKLIPKVIA